MPKAPPWTGADAHIGSSKTKTTTRSKRFLATVCVPNFFLPAWTGPFTQQPGAWRTSELTDPQNRAINPYKPGTGRSLARRCVLYPQPRRTRFIPRKPQRHQISYRDLRDIVGELVLPSTQVTRRPIEL